METQELAIKSQEIIKKSGVELELDITELHSLADQAKAIISVDDENFKEVKKSLANKRKEISEGFMDARKEFNRMSKGVIEIQNQLLDIFTPQEDRLKALDKAEKERLVREARLESLPARKERLAAIGDAVEVTYDELLGMEDADFEIYIVGRQSAKNEADRLALAAEKEAMEAENRRREAELAAEKAKQDAIEQARLEERQKAEDALKVEKERLKREKAEAEARRVREQQEAEERRLDAIRKEAAEKARIEQEEKDKVAAEEQAKKDAEAKRLADIKAKEADEKYQAWITGLGEGEFKFITLADGSVEAYKLVGTYAKN